MTARTSSSSVGVPATAATGNPALSIAPPVTLPMATNELRAIASSSASRDEPEASSRLSSVDGDVNTIASNEPRSISPAMSPIPGAGTVR